MANASAATRLFRRVRTRPAAAKRGIVDFTDFADFGTAFGLDLSLQPEAEAAAVPPPATVRGHAWWRRLAARRNAVR